MIRPLLDRMICRRAVRIATDAPSAGRAVTALPAAVRGGGLGQPGGPSPAGRVLALPAAAGAAAAAGSADDPPALRALCRRAAASDEHTRSLGVRVDERVGRI